MTISTRLSTLAILGLLFSVPGYSARDTSTRQEATPLSGVNPQHAKKEAEGDVVEAPKPGTPDQNGNFRIDENVVAPKVIHTVEPKIAKKDRKAAKSGVTIIQLTVAKDGSVQNAHVLKSSAAMAKPVDAQAAAVLDQSALDAVNQYRFQPATLNGQAVPVLLNVEVKFRIF